MRIHDRGLHTQISRLGARPAKPLIGGSAPKNPDWGPAPKPVWGLCPKNPDWGLRSKPCVGASPQTPIGGPPKTPFGKPRFINLISIAMEGASQAFPFRWKVRRQHFRRDGRCVASISGRCIAQSFVGDAVFIAVYFVGDTVFIVVIFGGDAPIQAFD